MAVKMEMRECLEKLSKLTAYNNANMEYGLLETRH